jgi:hypothetical protein
MRKYVPLLIAGSALIAAACRDSVSPSEATEAAALFSMDRSFSAAIHGHEAPGATNVSSLTFVLSHNGGTQKVGAFTLAYDANAVCNPETSGYGEAYWKKSCSTLNQPITITATSWEENGRSYTEFSPDIRFAPGKSVELSILREEIIGERLSLRTAIANNIWYVRRVGRNGFFVDEGWSDPYVRTQFDTQTGIVSRRIRHFSGWSVRSGDCGSTVTVSESSEVSSCVSPSVSIEVDGR